MIRRGFIHVSVTLILLCPEIADPATRVTAQGVIRSDERVSIKSKVAAPIRQIAVKEGDVVQQGELLIELLNEVERMQVETAKAEVERARSALAQADLAIQIAARELERNLKVEDLITEKDLDLSRDAVRTAEAAQKTKLDELSKAEAQLATAQANYEDTRIRAPFDGLVSRLYVRVGDTTKVSDTVLLDFLSLDKLYVEVALPLPHLPQIREGMGVRIEVESEYAAIKTVVEGAVRYVYPEVDPITRMFRVKVHLPRQGALVLPGMFTIVRIELPRRAP
jgi:RND family efflux transporter MFP subunit